MRRDLLPQPTLGTRGGTMGRPRKQPPADAAKRVEDLAASGCNVVDLAAALGTTKEMLRRWMMEDDALQLAFAVGRERERDELHRMILRDARDGEKPNINAMFLLKARHGYREGEPVESGAPRISVTFNLPGALSPDEYMKTVNNGPGSTEALEIPATRS
jgi:hypothetical protein